MNKKVFLKYFFLSVFFIVFVLPVFSQEFTILPNPVPPTIKAGEIIYFTPSFTENKIEWDFGDGEKYTYYARPYDNPITSHKYLKPGNYIVTAKTIKNNLNVSASLLVIVKEKTDSTEEKIFLTLNAFPHQGKMPLRVLFNTSIEMPSDVSLESVSFDYGDGKTEFLREKDYLFKNVFGHDYPKRGVYTPTFKAVFLVNSTLFAKRVEKSVKTTIRVFDETGSTGQDFEIIASNLTPEVNEKVSLKINTVLENIASVLWSFPGDNCSKPYCVKGKQISVSFDSPGEKTIKAIGISYDEKTIASAELKIFVKKITPKILVEMQPREGIVEPNKPIEFLAKLEPEIKNVFFLWKFREICISFLCKKSQSNQRVKHIYKATGSHKVTVLAKEKIPVLSDLFNVGLTIAKKTITVIVTKKGNKEKELQKNDLLADTIILANGKPKKFIKGRPPLPITFTAKLNFEHLNPFYEWSFDDGSVSNSKKVVHVFTENKRHVVELKIKDRPYGKTIKKDFIVIDLSK